MGGVVVVARKSIVRLALATTFLLMIPLVAMQFTSEVNWDLFDFIFMGILLFGSGLTYLLISQKLKSRSYKVAVGIAVAAGLLLIWMNGAVGIIGSENNPANTLYAGVLLVGLVGVGFSRFRPVGMKRAMFATSIAQALVPLIAMAIWRPALDDLPGIAGVFLLNSFFVALFVFSALLFRHAAESTQGEAAIR